MRKFSICIAFIIISNVLFLSGCHTGQTKAVTSPEVLAEFDFSIKDGAIFLPVTLNGEKYLFGLDTGSSYTIFDASLKKKLQNQHSLKSLKTDTHNTPIIVEYFQAPNAYLGPLNLYESQIIGVIDLDQSIPKIYRRFQGVIGMNFLKNYIVQIDFDNEKVIFFKGKKDFDIFPFLSPKENKHPEWGEPVKLKSRNINAKYIKGVLSDKTETEFLIDTGLPFAGTLQSNIFQGYEFTKKDTFLAIRPNLINIGNVIKTNNFSIPAFDYEGMLFQESNMSALGLPFLSHHLVTFDFPNNIMYLRKGKLFGKSYDFSIIFAGAEMVLSYCNIGLVVSHIDPKCLAYYKKGIRQYDIVTKIQLDEQVFDPFKPIDFLEFISKLPKQQVNTYTFTLKRGEEIFTVEFSKEELNSNK